MFKEPEKNIVIGITKSRMVETQNGDEDDIIKVARGEEGQTVSFKGYSCVVVEQDDDQSLKDMLAAVMEKGCIKHCIKRGFLDSFEVLNMFNRVKPDEDLR